MRVSDEQRLLFDLVPESSSDEKLPGRYKGRRRSLAEKLAAVGMREKARVCTLCGKKLPKGWEPEICWACTWNAKPGKSGLVP